MEMLQFIHSRGVPMSQMLCTTMVSPELPKEHQGFLKVCDGFYSVNRVGIFSLERADVSRQGGTVFHPVKFLGVLLEGSKGSWFLSTVQN